MAYGNDVYRDLEGRTREARQKADDLAAQLAEKKKAQMKRQAERLSLLKAMAKAQFGDIKEEGLPATLSRAQAAAEEALKEVEADVQRIRGLQAEAQQAVEKSAARVGDCDTAAGVVAERLKAARDRLSTNMAADPGWQRLKKEAEDTASQAGVAQAKAGAAQGERMEKEKPYLADPLFRYLYERAYNTPRYTASGITRMLDDWVASLCNYKQAVANFTLLHDLESFLERHAEEMQKRGGVAKGTFDECVAGWVKQSDIPVVEAELQSAEVQVQEAREALEQAKGTSASHAEALAALARGDDPRMRGAVEAMAKILGDTDLDELEELARNTPNNTEDDVIVAKLHTTSDQLSGLSEEIDDLRRRQEEASDEAVRLAELERQFMEENYHSRNSRFDNGFDMSAFIAGYLAGHVSINDLSGYQHTSSSYSTWSGDSMTSGIGSILGGLSSGGGSSSDDDSFFTGGGFGGGDDDGFRTGGGF